MILNKTLDCIVYIAFACKIDKNNNEMLVSVKLTTEKLHRLKDNFTPLQIQNFRIPKTWRLLSLQLSMLVIF